MVPVSRHSLLPYLRGQLCHCTEKLAHSPCRVGCNGFLMATPGKRYWKRVLCGVRIRQSLPHYIGGFARPNRTASIVWRDERGNVRIEQRTVKSCPTNSSAQFAAVFERLRKTDSETLVQGVLLAQRGR